MLRVTTGQQLDHLRMSKGNQLFGIQVARNNKLLDIYNAYYPVATIINYFYANRINISNETIEIFILDNSYLFYEDGQYLIDRTEDFIGNLPDGIYYLEFSNGTTVFSSEMFAISEQSFENVIPITEIKHFQDSPIFEFND